MSLRHSCTLKSQFKARTTFEAHINYLKTKSSTILERKFVTTFCASVKGLSWTQLYHTARIFWTVFRVIIELPNEIIFPCLIPTQLKIQIFYCILAAHSAFFYLKNSDINLHIFFANISWMLFRLDEKIKGMITNQILTIRSNSHRIFIILILLERYPLNFLTFFAFSCWHHLKISRTTEIKIVEFSSNWITSICKFHLCWLANSYLNNL